MQAVFDQEYVRRINGPNVKPAPSKMDHAEMLMEDIRQFQENIGRVAAVDDLVRIDRSLSPSRPPFTRRCETFEEGCRRTIPISLPARSMPTPR